MNILGNYFILSFQHKNNLIIVIGYDIKKETEKGSGENSATNSNILDIDPDVSEHVETCFPACSQGKKWTGTIMGHVLA